MVTTIKVARVLFTLVLAVLTISFVVGLARPETGVLEKVALIALIALCVGLAAKVGSMADRAVERVTTR